MDNGHGQVNGQYVTRSHHTILETWSVGHTSESSVSPRTPRRAGVWSSRTNDGQEHHPRAQQLHDMDVVTLGVSAGVGDHTVNA